MKKISRKKLILEAVVVIAVTLALVMPSSAVITESKISSTQQRALLKSDYRFVKADSGMGSTSVGTDILAAGDVEDEHTPSIVKDNDGNLWLFYVYDEGVDSDIYMRKSIDDGQTWPSEYVWYLPSDGLQLYPAASIDSFGMLWVAFVDVEQDTIVFLEGQDPNVDPTGWAWMQFDPTDSNTHDQLASLVTYESGGRTIAAWGYKLNVVYPPYSVDEAAVVEHNGQGVDQWTYTWDSTWAGKPANYPSLGASNDMFFFAFQYTDDVSGNEIINVRWGDAVVQSDMEAWPTDFGSFETSSSDNCYKPSIAGSGSNVILVYEKDVGGQKDLMCSYSSNDGDSWTHDVIVADDVADEENPRVTVVGSEAYCLYISNDNLYVIKSEDGGATWGDAEQVNDEAGSAEVMWRTADISFPYVAFTDNRGDSLDIYFDLAGEPPQIPQLEIGDITGGIGVSAIVKNTGDAAATDVEWTITVTGGILGFINKEITGTISSLAVDSEETISTGLIFGLGAIDISVEAKASGSNTATGEATGTQIIIFSMVS